MKRYADDYETIIENDERGREKKIAVYRGSYYDIAVDEKDIIKFRRNSLILIVAIIILHVAGGFIGNRGMYAFYIALPYVFVFLPLFFMVNGGLRLPKEQRKFRRDEIGLSYDRIRKACIFALILLGVLIIGEIAFMVWFAGEGRSLEIPFIIIESLALTAAYILYRMQRSMQVLISVEE